MNSRTNSKLLIIFALFAISIVIGLLNSTDPIITNILELFLGILAVLLIFQFPIIGLAIITLSAPLTDIFSRITFVNSIIPYIGLLTFFSYIINVNYRKRIKFNLTTTEIVGLIFIIWIIFSHPNASIFGVERSWAFTLTQLWILMWMARQFICTEKEHRQVIIILAIGILFSAVYAIQNTGLHLNLQNRAIGLGAGANTSARYFIYGILLLIYLQNYFSKKIILRLVLIFTIFVELIAVILTGSRTGIILLGIVAIFLLGQLFTKKKPIFVIIVFILGSTWYLTQAKTTSLQPQNIISAITDGTDTVGYRYDLWKAGLKIAYDHPFAGVGIGNFDKFLPYYWGSNSVIKANTSHNSFIEVLAETGVIGLFLFITLILLSFIKFITNQHNLQVELIEIKKIWFAILIVLIIGSFTKADLIDKLFWFMLGLTFLNKTPNSTN